MTRRITAIAFIFVCASVGWAILGGTIFSRTYSSDSLAENRVASTWGTQQTQSPPTASFTRTVPKQEEITENGSLSYRHHQGSALRFALRLSLATFSPPLRCGDQMSINFLV